MITPEERAEWQRQQAAIATASMAVGPITDEIYVPWGRPADEIQPPGIAVDPLEQARAGLNRMVAQVSADAWYRGGLLVWDVTARCDRLLQKIENRYQRGVQGIERACHPEIDRGIHRGSWRDCAPFDFDPFRGIHPRGM